MVLIKANQNLGGSLRVDDKKYRCDADIRTSIYFSLSKYNGNDRIIGYKLYDSHVRIIS